MVRCNHIAPFANIPKLTKIRPQRSASLPSPLPSAASPATTATSRHRPVACTFNMPSTSTEVIWRLLSASVKKSLREVSVQLAVSLSAIGHMCTSPNLDLESRNVAEKMPRRNCQRQPAAAVTFVAQRP